MLYHKPVFLAAAPLVTCQSGVATMQDSGAPLSPNSPGWKQEPHDVASSLGASVTFRCITTLTYRSISWTVNQQVVSGSSSKLQLHDSNKVAIYGPLSRSDEGVLIGCRVRTSFGLLPSHVGKITIKGEYEFIDLNYSVPSNLI